MPGNFPFSSHIDLTTKGEFPFMLMAFDTSPVVIFLFDSLTTRTVFWCFVGCLITFMGCVGVAFLSLYKRNYLTKYNQAHPICKSKKRENPLEVRLILSAIFFVQAFAAGLIMLLFMTFNIWVFIAIMFGSMTGYYIVESEHDYTSEPGKHCC